MSIPFVLLERMTVALKLAERGASAAVIESLAGVSRGVAIRYSRKKGNGGSSTRRRSSPRWYEAKLERLVHAHTVIMMYRVVESSEMDQAARLMCVYDAYLAMGLSGSFDINQVFEAVRFYGNGKGAIRCCSTCGAEHVTFAESNTCPMCRMDRIVICNTPKCTNILPERTGETRGRRRTLCDTCFRDRWKRNRTGSEPPHYGIDQIAGEALV